MSEFSSPLSKVMNCPDLFNVIKSFNDKTLFEMDNCISEIDQWSQNDINKFRTAFQSVETMMQWFNEDGVRFNVSHIPHSKLDLVRRRCLYDVNESLHQWSLDADWDQEKFLRNRPTH
jgi:hypothetical protein